MNRSLLYYVVGGIIIGLTALVALWLIFSNTSAPPDTQGGAFGTGTTNTTVTPATPDDTNQLQPLQNQAQKIFKISNGPVAGAGFSQILHPTTTLARWVMADNGHAFEVVLDSPGAIPRVLSNTTIPGAQSASWSAGGGGALLQYLQGSLVKTLFMGLTAATTTRVRLTYYPDGIVGAALSPDGASAAYLLQTAAGVDGYVSKQDGTGGKKVFSLPLSQVRLSWPSANTLLAYSKAASGVPGIAFSIDVRSGIVTPLVYGMGLTATADPSFLAVLYQRADGNSQRTFIHEINGGREAPLPIQPAPERCVWAKNEAYVAYCATPAQATPPNYLDLWYQGVLGFSDTIFKVDAGVAGVRAVATPGEGGGFPTDILSLEISPDGKYLLFVAKYDRSLWGVRLSQ